MHRPFHVLYMPLKPLHTTQITRILAYELGILRHLASAQPWFCLALNAAACPVLEHSKPSHPDLKSKAPALRHQNGMSQTLYIMTAAAAQQILGLSHSVTVSQR